MHIRKSFYYILAVLFICLQVSSLSAAGLESICSECHSSPKEVLQPEHTKIKSFSDCTKCHETGKKGGSLGDKIHIIHTEAEGVSEDTCLTCHKDDGSGNIIISSTKNVVFPKEDMEFLVEKYSTWNDSNELAEYHRLAGVGCSDCHTNYDYDDYDAVVDKCKGCHGDYPELAPKTKDKERNPHQSHFGNLNCAKCHQVHEPFKDFCDKCHQTNMEWNRKDK